MEEKEIEKYASKCWMLGVCFGIGATLLVTAIVTLCWVLWLKHQVGG